MRFVDFLRATVLLSGGAATTLAVLTLVAATRDQDDALALYATGWWVAATRIGSWIGRRNEVNPPIAKLLADAKAGTMMPDVRPGATMINRLWPDRRALATLVLARPGPRATAFRHIVRAARTVRARRRRNA